MKPFYVLLFSLAASTLTPSAWVHAAACCGTSGAAVPSILSGDHQAQLSALVSFTEVAVDSVDSRGVWRKWEHHQQVQNFRIEGAHLLSDRWQLGAVLPFVRRSRLHEKHSGLADASVSTGYEFLPDWDYNPIRPKGIAFLQLVVPTGKSKAESDVGGLDSRGNGYWAIGVGTLLSKTIGDWDFLTSFEIHRSFQKKFTNSLFQGTLKPGYGGSLSVGAGYNFSAFRLGTSIAWNYEDPIRIEGPISSQGSIERHATGTLSLSYLNQAKWSATLSYSDQTLFGAPINTSLGKTIALQIQQRWDR